MKKLSPSLTWRRQDTNVRTNGRRSRATVSWTPVCASQVQGLARGGGRRALEDGWAGWGEGVAGSC